MEAGLLVIAGAVVGAIASFVGSVCVQRREVVRGARLRMYDDLVPSLRRDATGNHFSALWRCAVIAGRQDLKLVADIQRCLEELDKTPLGALEQTIDGFVVEYAGTPERQAAAEALEQRWQDLEAHLARKINPSVRWWMSWRRKSQTT